MELGIHVWSFTGPATEALAPTLARTGQAAEAAGVGTLTVMDHWFQMDAMAPAEDPMMEGYTTSASSPGTPRRSGSACS